MRERSIFKYILKHDFENGRASV